MEDYIEQELNIPCWHVEPPLKTRRHIIRYRSSRRLQRVAFANRRAPLARFDRPTEHSPRPSRGVIIIIKLNPVSSFFVIQCTHADSIQCTSNCNRLCASAHTLGEQFGGGGEEVRKKHHHCSRRRSSTNAQIAICIIISMCSSVADAVLCCCWLSPCWLVGGRAKEVQITGRKLKWRHGWIAWWSTADDLHYMPPHSFIDRWDRLMEREFPRRHSKKNSLFLHQ